MTFAHYLIPDWPAPSHVRACTTLRDGGHSQGAYQSFNMGWDILDNAEHVAQNHHQLCTELQLTQPPVWLRQQHGAHAVCAEKAEAFTQADASYTAMSGVPCVVLTADCMPILLCNRRGSHVAAIHAGWRGLASGIIASTLDKLQQPPADWLVWLGPTIGRHVYEVGDEVKAAFTQKYPEAESAFQPSPAGRWLADLYLLARQQLHRYGINAIYGGQYCTYSDATRFYSYRRDGKYTGRMASLIWMQE